VGRGANNELKKEKRIMDNDISMGNIFCVKHNINVFGYCHKCNQEANEKMWEAVNKLDYKFTKDAECDGSDPDCDCSLCSTQSEM